MDLDEPYVGQTILSLNDNEYVILLERVGEKQEYLTH